MLLFRGEKGNRYAQPTIHIYRVIFGSDHMFQKRNLSAYEPAKVKEIWSPSLAGIG